LELNNGVFQVLSTNGNTRLGGDDIDKRVIDFLVEKIKAAGGPDAVKDNPMLSRIREVAEQTKIRLSSDDAVDVQLPFLTPTFSLAPSTTKAKGRSSTRRKIRTKRWRSARRFRRRFFQVDSKIFCCST